MSRWSEGALAGAGRPGPAPRAPRARLPRAAVAIAAAAALLLAAVALVLDRGSVERANRLHRAGDTTRAIGLYRAALERSASGPELSYNLGTAWLGQSTPG